MQTVPVSLAVMRITWRLVQHEECIFFLFLYFNGAMKTLLDLRVFRVDLKAVGQQGRHGVNTHTCLKASSLLYWAERIEIRL